MNIVLCPKDGYNEYGIVSKCWIQYMWYYFQRVDTMNMVLCPNVEKMNVVLSPDTMNMVLYPKSGYNEYGIISKGRIH